MDKHVGPVTSCKLFPSKSHLLEDECLNLPQKSKFLGSKVKF